MINETIGANTGGRVVRFTMPFSDAPDVIVRNVCASTASAILKAVRSGCVNVGDGKPELVTLSTPTNQGDQTVLP
jgi:hypothetical protein